jgi:hypothetical protein
MKAEGVGSSGTLRIEAGTWLNKFIETLLGLWLGVVFLEKILYGIWNNWPSFRTIGSWSWL